MIKRLLPKASIFTASNGMEVLETLSHHKIDLIILDIQMPILDGLEASKNIRAAGNMVPIIGLSAGTSPEEETMALTCGMNIFIKNPLKKKSLKPISKKLLKDYKV